MARRIVDLLAAGPRSADPYDPAAPAWALAGGLAARGHAVQVVFPGEPNGVPPPAGVTGRPFPAVTTHVGSFAGDAELARAAARGIRSEAEVIVRDPAGLGSLGHHAGHRPVVSFVRFLASDPPPPPADGTRAGLRARVAAWGTRRGARRLEKEALDEATTICCANAALRERLLGDYGLAPERLRVVPPAVEAGPDPPSREAARRALTVPDDIVLTVALPPPDPGTAGTAPPVADAFQRTRPIFPGARLVVLGVPGASGPGVVAAPSRDLPSLMTAVVAADVVVASGPAGALDPGIVLGLRAGAACVVPSAADLGDGAADAVRSAPTADAGELASVLAELFADPAERHALGERGRALARRFEPSRLAEELETAGALGPR